jgi:hypothetical protein
MTKFSKLESVIKQTMVSICYSNLDSDTPDNIERDVDVSFTAIDYAFPEIQCICDTVTRRCAKSEIYEVLRQAQAMKQINGNYRGVLEMIEQSITAESVMEDIINMNSDDDEEIELDFDTVKVY